VTLATLHAAKGLEWDAVFLVGLSDGLLPTSLAETGEAVAEERRLLYVGVTRAREHLQLSYARSRLPGGRPNRRASRFLAALWPGSSPHPARGADPESDPRTTLTLAALERWRQQRARELGLAPGRVLATHVLRSVAGRRPTTRAELAQVPGVGAQTVATVGDEIVAAVLGAAR
jgi:DNA helicase II / ATP-dependent DNA helicase PcrA